MLNELVESVLVKELELELGGLELKCLGCGGIRFRSYGVSKIGGVEMLGYRCVLCNRGIALDRSMCDIVEKEQDIVCQDGLK